MDSGQFHKLEMSLNRIANALEQIVKNTRPEPVTVVREVRPRQTPERPTSPKKPEPEFPDEPWRNASWGDR